MPNVHWFYIPLLGAIGSSFALGACFLGSVGDCEQNGTCVEGSKVTSDAVSSGSAGNPAPDGGDAGGGPGDPKCDGCVDDNPCTHDICVYGRCSHPTLSDGTPLDSTTCGLKCFGGEAVAAVRGKLCENGGVCDGAGSCVACDAEHACPVVGQAYCVEGKCCGASCGPCKVCDEGSQYMACVDAPRYSEHSLCEDSKVCDGEGDCKTVVGGTCNTDNACISGNCSGSNHQIGTCQPER
jgi:hypothetical protein